MPTMAEMVEAHLMNVQREIVNLNDRKVALEKDIEKLEQYLVDGQATLLEAKSVKSTQKTASPSIFNP